jgi:tRNA dimethylallyltransferase
MLSQISTNELPIVAIIGPTGSGKSDLGLFLAEQLGGEIVNCDSVQVYRGFDIGTAKVPTETMRRVSHHLIDVLGPGEECSAGKYARLGRVVIRDIRRRGRIPIVVGGTGFYLRALFEGLSPAPERSPELRVRLQRLAARRRPGALHRLLHRFDPARAARIHANDIPKLIRAIEITFLSGRPATQAQAAARDALPDVHVLKLGLVPDRQALYSRLSERTEWMFENGLIEETQQLLRSGYDASSKPMQSLGYRQAVQFLCGNTSLDCAIQDCKARTRNYAKRQITWFRAEKDVCWLRGFGSDPEIREIAVEKTNALLAATSPS